MIGLTTGLLMFASTYSPSISVLTKAIDSEVSIVKTTPDDLNPNDFKTLEDYVRTYFRDTPILAEIARCESRFRQYNEDGAVLHGKVNKGDIGIMQINKYYHAENADKLGYDIYSVKGNVAYAKKLYDKYGDDPWSSSLKCWKPRVVAINRN